MPLLSSLRMSSERNVDIYNHKRIQMSCEGKLESIFEETYLSSLRQLISKCKSATTLVEKFKCVKELLDKIENKLIECETTPFLSRLLNIEFVGLVTEGNLDFLTSDDLSLEERADKFLHYLEQGGQTQKQTKNAFEQYITAWRINKRGVWKIGMITRAEAEMRDDFAQAVLENKELFSNHQLIKDLKEHFEPLRHKLVEARTEHRKATAFVHAAAGAIVLVPGLFAKAKKGVRSNSSNIYIVTDTTRDAKAKAQASMEQNINYRLSRLCDPEWYNKAEDFITEFLLGKKLDQELKAFIEREHLQEDLHHFIPHLHPWLDEINLKINNIAKIATKFHMVTNDLTLKEMDRTWKSLYAVLLNRPEMLEEHQDMLDSMIFDAANNDEREQSGSLLPSIFFGQLHLPDGKEERFVLAKFVLKSSIDEQTTNGIIKKLGTLFGNFDVKIKNHESGVNVIEMRIVIDDNVSNTVTRFISNLADHQIHGVLIGDLGLRRFRHAMNPAYNRIYSVKEVDKADGFIPTYFSGSLDRGGEPYFCPSGWRRYSIDVGCSGDEFEARYKDWHVAYHGTEGHIAMAILLNGIRASDQGCFLKSGEGAVYLSPSIEYSGHPRYAKVWKVNEKYVQVVLQVRVDNKLVFEKKPGTIRGAFPKDPPIDKNFFNNNQLEWVIKCPPGTAIGALNGILVYGLMLRVSDLPLEKLPQNAWWSAPRNIITTLFFL